jgi:glucan phosphoethanolaminetransferase (alkaline phosphatase superfamily)
LSVLVAALWLLLPGLDLRLLLSVLVAALWLLLPGLDLRLLLSVLSAALLLSALALRLLIVLSAALLFALALLLALVLLLFALALLLALAFLLFALALIIFVFLRCVNRDSPENQEQNSCTDQSDSLKKSSSYFVISTLLHKMPPSHSIPLTTFNLRQSLTRSTQRAVHV